MELAAGRVQDQYVHVDLYAGYGNITSLSGSVIETRGFGPIEGGLNTDLGDLGIDEGTETTLFGGSLTYKWVTLLVDIRNNTVDASGTAESDIRVNVDGLNFNGLDLEYLLIPVGSDYTVDSQSNWIGAGLRITPFTINPTGRLRFTPWIHLGAQYVDTSFDIDSGNTVRLEVPGFENRVFAVQGQASGEAQLIIPEYGIGAEFRLRFHNEGERGMQLVASGTYKILSYDGELSSLGVDNDDFEDLIIDYTALDLGLELLFPLGDYLQLKAGLFLEQVEADVDLVSKQGAGDFRRELDGEYTLTGFRMGVRF